MTSSQAKKEVNTPLEATSASGVKRYNLVLPEALYEEIQKLAEEERISVVELLRKFIKLGLVATKTLQNPDSAIILREGDKEREILFL